MVKQCLALCALGVLATSPAWGEAEFYECPGGLYTDHPSVGCKKLELQDNRVMGAEFYGVPDEGTRRAPAVALTAPAAETTYDSAEECALYKEYLDLMQQGGSVTNGISPDKFMRRATLARMFGPSLYGGGRHPHCP
ncbi:hypothetical protein [Nitrospira sp. Nam74]